LENKHQIPIGVIVRRSRQLRNWSQRKLADESNLSLNCIWTLERNEKKPTCETVKALAAALGITVSELFGETID
jgi:transcriptional regulator with XRE-family HTH domain